MDDRPEQKPGWYRQWHEHPKYPVVHWLLLLTFVATAFWVIQTNLLPQEVTFATGVNIEVYPGPGADAYKSNFYSVEVFDGSSWQPSYTYKHSRVSASMWHQNTSPSVNFTTFGASDSVSVRISKIGGSITTANVSPKSKNIPVSINSGKATLTLSPNHKAWVTVNGDDSNPLFIFADNLKPAVPSGATYFGPGVYNLATSTSGHYFPANNETIYIDGGAWLRGNIDIRGKTNVRIMGPGVLSGDLWTSEAINALPTFNEKMAYAMVYGDWGGNNGTVEGVTIVASPTYNFRGGTRSATNVKLLSPWYYSTDGFQAVNHVDQSFAFIGDNVFFPAWAGVGNDNVTITNSFAGTTNNSVFNGGFWGNDASNTYTSFADNIDIKTYNSDVWVPFGAPLSPAAFQIWVDNNNPTRGYSNQTYQNIRIEGSLNVPVAMVKNMVYPWGGPNAVTPPLGNSYNLVFKNITLEGTQKYLSELKGYDANNGFHNVVLDNWTMGGNLVTSANVGSYIGINSYVWGLSINPLTLSLSANPTSINSGQSSTLNWTSTNTASCTASGGWSGAKATSGSETVSPTVTSVYNLDCSGNGTSTAQSVTVTVSPPPPPMPTASLTASPSSIVFGQSSALYWNTTDAAQISIDQGIGNVSASGTLPVSPTVTTTYTITASNSSGSASSQATVTVEPLPLPTASFSASPTSINLGSSSTLSWSTTDASSVSIDQGIGAVAANDSLTVSPTITTTYTLTAANPSGAVTKQVTVTVVQPDTTAPTTNITFPVNNSQVDRSSVVTITANATDNVAVQRVEFYVSNALKCTDTAAPYSCNWTVPGAKNKVYTLFTKAFDAAGNMGTSPVVTVSSK